jgi:hypothetical protein
MDQLLKWLGQYSAPVVLLLALGAVLIYVIQQVVERVIDGKFAEHDKRMELLLVRRSKFEEKVLLDQYELVTTLQLRLAGIGADINRMRSGTPAEGFMQGREIVPLTQVYVDLQARRFLLKEPFYRLLNEQADALLASANAASADEFERAARRYLGLIEDLRGEMNRTFGIDAITWETLGLRERPASSQRD